jgi:hypothetical protein
MEIANNDDYPSAGFVIRGDNRDCKFHAITHILREQALKFGGMIGRTYGRTVGDGDQADCELTVYRFKTANRAADFQRNAGYILRHAGYGRTASAAARILSARFRQMPPQPIGEQLLVN